MQTKKYKYLISNKYLKDGKKYSEILYDGQTLK